MGGKQKRQKYLVEEDVNDIEENRPDIKMRKSSLMGSLID